MNKRGLLVNTANRIIKGIGLEYGNLMVVSILLSKELYEPRCLQVSYLS